MDRNEDHVFNGGTFKTLTAVLVAACLVFASTMPGTAPTTLAQFSTDTPTPEPTESPEHQCVASNGVWSHDSCHHLQVIHLDPQIVTNCGVSADHTGRVTCSVGLSGDLPPIAPAVNNALSIAPGCLSINRSPYPRLMVGLGSPTISIGPAPFRSGSVQVSSHNSSFIAPGYPVSGNRQGWYNTWIDGATISGVSGITMTVAGNWYGISYQYATESLGVARNDWYVEGSSYPSIRNLAVRLLYVMQDTVDVGMGLSGSGGAGGPEAPMASGTVPSAPLKLDGGLLLTVTRSSNPAPGGPSFAEHIVNRGGPDLNGMNTLPAYMLQVRSYWVLYMQYGFENWTISGGSYHMTSRVGPITRTVDEFAADPSFRSWDRRQGNLLGLVGQPYCNADSGYIPVPVMEGHTVLVH